MRRTRRRRGLGLVDMLLDEAAAWARTQACARLVLEVSRTSPRARSAYLRAGFVPTGRSRALPGPRGHIVEDELAREL